MPGKKTKSFIEEEIEQFKFDCPNDNTRSTVLPPVKRIIVLGDIHGDLMLAKASLRIAKVVDENDKWIGGDTVVVQVGDQIDSCKPLIRGSSCHDKPDTNSEGINIDLVEDIEVMKYFDEIDNKARKWFFDNGGKHNENEVYTGPAVYSLLGNHELMNVEGMMHSVSYNNYYNFEYGDLKGPEGRKKAFEPGGVVAKKMACTRPSVMVIGSNLFVHGGILPEVANQITTMNIDPHRKLSLLNQIVRKWLLTGKKDYREVSENMLNVLVQDLHTSPFWNRTFGREDPSCDKLKESLSVFKVGRMIVGHTPQIPVNGRGINGVCKDPQGKYTLVRTDGGFSRAFYKFNLDQAGMVQVLEIKNDSDFTIIQTALDVDRLKPESEMSEKYMKEFKTLPLTTKETISSEKKRT